LFHRYDARQRTRAHQGPQPILRDLSFGTHLRTCRAKSFNEEGCASAALGQESPHGR
jgi:hypothetical protein